MKGYYLLLQLLFFSVVLLAQNEDTLVLDASPTAGFYTGSTSVKLQANKANAVIYYTINGSKPSINSRRYNSPITVDTTTIIRAIVYVNENLSSSYTGTFFINEGSISLPVISIGIEPAILFDPVRGVFMRGPRASPKFPHVGANFYSRTEFPCHMEFFETDKEPVFKHDLGFKVFGGMSRIFPQKSFSLYADKSRHGIKHIEHQVFLEKSQKKYKRLVFRNSGSDFGETHFRDALITSFGKEMGLETQAYRPSIVFINGAYWGIYNIREKLTKHYLVENFGYKKDSINLVEHQKSVKAGSRQSYDAMRSFMRSNDLSIQANFDHVAQIMDVENFMEYQILQIYIDNQDAGGNIKFWQPKTEGGKWRWILFDTDFGLGHYGRFGYRNNSLAFHTKPDGPNWPNPPWSTLNLRSLLQNKDFQIKFVSRFLDRMNYTLDSNRIISRIDEMAAKILPELPRHWEKWNLSEKRWYKEIERMKEFSQKRPEVIREHLRQHFSALNLGKDVLLQIHADSNGIAILNDVIPVSEKFNGIYFQKLPVSVKAKPYFGAHFSHWEMDGERIEGKELTLRFSDTIHILKAIFIKQVHPLKKQFIINEISFGDTLSGDWIEFYNNSTQKLNLKDWKIVNSSGKTYVFGDIFILPKEHLVICNNSTKFQQAFPACNNYIDNLQFKLGKKEIIMIYDNLENPVDSIGYDLSKDSIKHLALALIDFNLDNTSIDNWSKIQHPGSPAVVNPDYLKIKEQEDWNRFLSLVKIGGIITIIFIIIVTIYSITRKRRSIEETSKD